MLWFAWKYLSLWYQQQQQGLKAKGMTRCDLLENIYLCGINNNIRNYILLWGMVVICLKISIFVVSTTTFSSSLLMKLCCDLLENIYLCGINNNRTDNTIFSVNVVICLKISIFVVSTTTVNGFIVNILLLWFAWKYLSLWYQQQLLLLITLFQ